MSVCLSESQEMIEGEKKTEVDLSYPQALRPSMEGLLPSNSAD